MRQKQKKFVPCLPMQATVIIDPQPGAGFTLRILYWFCRFLHSVECEENKGKSQRPQFIRERNRLLYCMYSTGICGVFFVHLHKYLCEVAPLESGMEERPKNGLMWGLLKEKQAWNSCPATERLLTSIHYWSLIMDWANANTSTRGELIKAHIIN